jgi:outer membrane protein OmpA-like peptidoglycan-associated protein
MKLRYLVCATLLGLAPTLAFAGEEANAPTVTGETGLFSLLTGDTLPRGNWSFGIYANNYDRVLRLSGVSLPGKIGDLDWNVYSASLGVGITDRWEVSASIPYDDYQFHHDPRVEDLNQRGQGNVRVGTKLRLFGNPGDNNLFAINGFVEVPTGKKEVVSDRTGYGVGLDWSVRNWVIDVGYRDPGGRSGDGVVVIPGGSLGPDVVVFDPTRRDVEKQVIAGIGYAGRVSDRLDWITEVVGTFNNASSGQIRFKDSYDVTTGGRLWLGESQNWAFNFGLRADFNQLSSVSDHCPLGGLLGLTYFPAAFRRPATPPAPPAPPPPPPPPPAPAPPPPAPEAPPPPPPAPAPKPEERVTVNFTPGSARLSNIAKAKLDEVALKMKQDPTLHAQVQGYTDASGNAAANQRMSEQRAQAVKNYLVQRHGIDPSRITTEGRGSQDSTGNAAQDRRAVVILTVQ